MLSRAVLLAIVGASALLGSALLSGGSRKRKSGGSWSGVGSAGPPRQPIDRDLGRGGTPINVETDPRLAGYARIGNNRVSAAMRAKAKAALGLPIGTVTGPHADPSDPTVHFLIVLEPHANAPKGASVFARYDRDEPERIEAPPPDYEPVDVTPEWLPDPYDADPDASWDVDRREP